MKLLIYSMYLFFALLGVQSLALAGSVEENKEAAENAAEADSKDTKAEKKSAKKNKKKDDVEEEDEEDERPEWEKFYEKELAKLNFEKAKLEHKKEMLELEHGIAEAEDQKMLTSIEAERRRLILENELTEQLVRKEQLRIELRKVKHDYLLEPYQDEQLYISDRRISLNGPVYSDIADEITRYIHYYNNKNSEYPIFLVIDSCPGGSVLEGARIIEAMRNSKAPVYVVVKSAAVSMCAVITALAERSFAYPNALILHHQMMGLFYGNSTQISERMKITEEWSKRLMYPVAQKMGLDLEAFVKAMYEHNTDGNWMEFANDAQKLGWVDHVVSSIRETSYIDEPMQDEEESQRASLVVLEDKWGGQGQSKPDTRHKFKLPPLGAGDFYHLYDPEGIYKLDIQ